MDDERVRRAVRFLREVTDAPEGRLNAVLAEHMGAGLAEFFTTYATHLMRRAPERAQENGAALMLLGYLFAGYERGAVRVGVPPHVH